MVLQAAIALVSSVIVILGAGFPLTFSLYATSLQSVLGYSQTEVNSVNISNIVGQFICYPLLGALSDRYGAHVVASFGAVFTIPALLFAASAYEKKSSCAVMSVAFFLIGVGSTCGYITAVSTSARSLPNQKGLAVSIPVCGYGLATLIYSVIFQTFFSGPDGYRIPAFWRSITIFVGFACLVGFFGMRVPHSTSSPSTPIRNDSNPDESEPLLESDATCDASDSGSSHADRPPFFKDSTVLLYAAGYVLIAGSTETLVGNMGSILDSITSAATTSTTIRSTSSSDASTAVSLFALFSTASRLISGLLSDSLSSHAHSRMIIPLFLVGIPLSVILLSLSLVPASPSLFMVLVAANGFVYGTMYASGPTIAAEVWGLPDFGRNWGVLSYSPLIGSTVFSLLYAILYDASAERQQGHGGGGGGTGKCVGKECFGVSMGILGGSVVVGTILWTLAWRTWKRRGIVV